MIETNIAYKVKFNPWICREGRFVLTSNIDTAPHSGRAYSHKGIGDIIFRTVGIKPKIKRVNDSVYIIYGVNERSSFTIDNSIGSMFVDQLIGKVRENKNKYHRYYN